MSASEKESGLQDGGTVKTKRRRLHGACDACRQRKIRCDSAEKPGQKCSNCIAFSSECTHIFATQRKEQGPRNRPRPSTFSQPASLGQLRQRMDPLLKSILSGSYQTPGNGALVRESMVALARYARALEAGLPAEAFTGNEAAEVPPSPPPPSADRPMPSDEPQTALFKDSINEDISNLTENLKRSLTLSGAEDRFFGFSSSVSLLDTPQVPEEASSGSASQQPVAIPVKVQVRPEFWSIHPWEKPAPPETPSFDFPPPDLLTELVRLYFAHLDTCVSLLHRPTFERSIAAGLHLSDAGFAGVVLAVCSVASRYTNDDRVLLEGYPSRHSSGYKWFRQLKLFNENLSRVPSLYDLQAIALATVYLQGSSNPELCWYLIGIGIRAAQDIGWNRKVPGPPTIEGELRKRAFWLLVMEESAVSSAVGRPPAITFSDIDLDLPIECDSEYWENPNPELAFKQPAGIPSKVTFFCFVIKLFKIVYSSQKTFYAVQRPDPPLGISPKEWDRITLANLDSELNAWIDALPEFLRWDPNRPADGVFFDQSAMLLAAYYHVQIFLHRPFIGFADDPVLALSSLAICTNAARACGRIMEAHSQKGFIPTPQSQIALFTSGLMLMLHVWRARLAGRPLSDEARELKSVQSCINVLRTYEDRWQAAGRFCDILTAMTSVDSQTEPAPRPAKRNHSSIEGETPQLDDTASSPPSSNPDLGSPASSSSHSFGPTRVAASYGNTGLPSTGRTQSMSADQLIEPQGLDVPIDFPLYSDELSKPFHMFSSMESVGYDLSLNEHLDELEAMWAQIQSMSPLTGTAPGIQTNVASPDTNPLLFGSSSTLIGPHSPPNALGTASSMANRPFMGGNIAPPGHAQGTPTWGTVPSGYDLDEWQRYLANTGGFTTPLRNFPFGGDAGGSDGLNFP